jgi:hypothetical protein
MLGLFQQTARVSKYYMQLKSNDTFCLKVVLCAVYTTGKLVWLACVLLCGCASNFGFASHKWGINTKP